MKYLMAPDLARLFNLTGQRDKRAFQALHLNQILFGNCFGNISLFIHQKIVINFYVGYIDLNLASTDMVEIRFGLHRSV